MTALFPDLPARFQETYDGDVAAEAVVIFVKL
jgi:hypothetical protein